MKLEPHRVGGERSARQSRPLDRAFALLDPLLCRAALIVEGDDPLEQNLVIIRMYAAMSTSPPPHLPTTLLIDKRATLVQDVWVLSAVGER